MPQKNPRSDNKIGAECVTSSKCCKKCGVDKDMVEFSKDITRKDGLCTYCKSCNAEYKRGYQKRNKGKIAEIKKSYYLQNKKSISCYRKQWYQDNKEKVNTRSRTDYIENRFKYLKLGSENRQRFSERVHNYFGGCCFICGVDEPFYEIYDCHHVEPETKEQSISNLIHKNWELEVVPELEKCVYLCVTCHRKLHHHRFNEDLESGCLILTPGRREG